MEKKLLRLVRTIKPRVLVRLTYPKVYPSAAEARKHLDQLIDHLQRWNNSGLWFLSFQARGAPFFWLMLKTFVKKDQLSRTWFEIVDSKDPAHLLAGVSVSGFQFTKGSYQFVSKTIQPIINSPKFQYGTFGSFKAKLLSLF